MSGSLSFHTGWCGEPLESSSLPLPLRMERKARIQTLWTAWPWRSSKIEKWINDQNSLSQTPVYNVSLI